MKTMRDFMPSAHSTMAGIQAHQQEGAVDEAHTAPIPQPAAW